MKLYYSAAGIGLLSIVGCGHETEKQSLPNIILLMSDNQSWNHLGCYGDPVVKTPNIDKISADGVRFMNAFCSVPSSSPARASMLTGQDIWRLEEGANLWGILPAKFEVFPELLENNGYHIGYEGKGWGPGEVAESGRKRNPAGNKYNSFEEFLNDTDKGQPFFYWFSSRNPHRPYRTGGGESEGIDTSKIVVPPYLPDVPEVKTDIADYYAELQAFDREVGGFIALLKETGQLENTIIIVCSDNGWQMPRGLANLYDFGTKVPLIISMPERYQGGRVIDDFVMLNDIAPTLLEVAGIKKPDYMTANSFLDILESDKDGVIDPKRDFVVTARERHAYVRQGGLGYGGRAIQTRDFLYIKNYEPERWPAGDPPLYGDVDAHMLHYPSPTKIYMLKHRDEEGTKKLYELAFAKRPAEELYDLRKDPYQLCNVAYNPDYKDIKANISRRLIDYLVVTSDPRETGSEQKWLDAKYYSERDKTPHPSPDAIKELGLEQEYKY
jgi:arylsulfatase A-like enzyme